MRFWRWMAAGASLLCAGLLVARQDVERSKGDTLPGDKAEYFPERSPETGLVVNTESWAIHSLDPDQIVDSRWNTPELRSVRAQAASGVMNPGEPGGSWEESPQSGSKEKSAREGGGGNPELEQAGGLPLQVSEPYSVLPAASQRTVIPPFLVGVSTQSVDKLSLNAPNLLWHNRETGESRVWYMRGSEVDSTEPLPPTGANHDQWRMAGRGDFDKDGQADIVWQDEGSGAVYVWFMKNTRFADFRQLKDKGDARWRIMGVADFNRDGYPDVAWQHTETGEACICLMAKHTQMPPPAAVLETVREVPLPAAGSPGWRIAGIGHFDLVSSSPSWNVPDFILRNAAAGLVAIWRMRDGPSGEPTGTVVYAGMVLKQVQLDPDWSLAETVSLDGGNLNDDLLWRHNTLGLNTVWYHGGTVHYKTGYIAPERDPAWRAAGQSIGLGRHQLEVAKASAYWMTAQVRPNSPGVQVSFRYPWHLTDTRLSRRKVEETNWTVLKSPITSQTHLDATAADGNRYEYRLSQISILGGIQDPNFTLAAVNAPPIENRGRAIVLVDEELSEMVAENVGRFVEDLAGDGWTVAQETAPRHDDHVWDNNAARTREVKGTIKEWYMQDTNNARLIVLLGHVAVPYSGLQAGDFHTCANGARPDHQGAWSTDMFYADVDRDIWPDVLIRFNCDFTANLNVSNDSKFDWSYWNGGFDRPMKAAAGRVDFAKLPSFGTGINDTNKLTREAELLNNYLVKNHAYRHKALEWQGEAPARGLIYGYFSHFDNGLSLGTTADYDPRNAYIYSTAFRLFDPDGTSLREGDIFFRHSGAMAAPKPQLWGFQAGPGNFDRINGGWGCCEHSAASLGENEPQAVFHMLTASFMADFNSQDDNFMRSLLTGPQFGLAALWTYGNQWRIDALGVGEHLGAALTRYVNQPGQPTSKWIYLNILGDPSLRHVTVSPPSNVRHSRLSPSILKLDWSGTPGNFYHVYRSTNALGPFERVSAAPIPGESYVDTRVPAGTNIYMVRALKLAVLDNGSFTNISQGAFATVP